jgi:hypothetical protein
MASWHTLPVLGLPRHERPAVGLSALPSQAFRRSRLALERERLTNGASIAAWPLPFITAAADVCIAAIFSAVMRRYSAGEQVPLAISKVRRKIVSQETAVNLAIVIAIERG